MREGQTITALSGSVRRKETFGVVITVDIVVVTHQSLSACDNFLKINAVMGGITGHAWRHSS